MPAEALDLVGVAPLDHDTHHRLGTGGAQHHATVSGQFALDFTDRGFYMTGSVDIEASTHTHVDEGLREHRHACLQLCQRLAGLTHDRQYFKRGDDAIAGSVLIETDNVPGGFAAQLPTLLLQQAHDVAVADGGALKRYFMPRQRLLKT